MQFARTLCAASLLLASSVGAQTDVTFRVTAPGAAPATLTTGGGATVSHTVAGQSFGFTPRIASDGRLIVDVRALAGTLPDPAAPVLETLAVGGPGALAVTRGGWTIHFIGRRTRTGGDAVTTMDSCCVTCGGTTACACKVVLWCGHCCVVPCCGDDTRVPRRTDRELASLGAVWSRAMYVTDCTYGTPAEGLLPAILRGT